MQINVHNFTLTAKGNALVTVQADSINFREVPKAVIRHLSEMEALDLTGFEWLMTSATPYTATAPNGDALYAYEVTLTKA